MNRNECFLSMIGAMAFLLGLAASSSAQEERPPLIRASPNPISVPPGQTSGTTTLTWNGGKDHPYAEVWVRVDENDETFIVESGKGTRQATVELGKTYVFKLSDANVLLASVTVTARQGAPSGVNEPRAPVGVPPRSSAPNSPGAYSVSGKIRWKKELGMLPMYPGSKDAYPTPCGTFFAAALQTVGQGFSARQEPVATITALPGEAGPVPQEGDFYVCTYTLANLPPNKDLLIMAGQGGTLKLPQVDTDPRYTTSPWLGGSRPAPPEGQQRDFSGSRNVTLTSQRPTAKVDFEIVYNRKDLGVN